MDTDVTSKSIKRFKSVQGRHPLTAEEEELCIDLRKRGYTYQQIANEIDRSTRTVIRFFQRKQQEYKKYSFDRYIELMDMQMDRLEALFAAYWDAATSGKNIRAAQVVMNVIMMEVKLVTSTRTYLEQLKREKKEKQQEKKRGLLIELVDYSHPETWQKDRDAAAVEE